MNTQQELDRLPTVNEFRINQIGSPSVEVEGNSWFCHSPEVKAYKQATESLIETLAAIKQQLVKEGV